MLDEARNCEGVYLIDIDEAHYVCLSIPSKQCVTISTLVLAVLIVTSAGTNTLRVFDRLRWSRRVYSSS